MIQLRLARARQVILIGRVAIKLPRHRRGLACNRYELNVFRNATPHRRSMLCPILWVAPWGIVLVMRRAKPVTRAEFKDILDRTFRHSQGDYFFDTGPALPDWDRRGADDQESPFEPKADDWGWLDGRLVAVDYSVQAAVPDLPS